MIKENIYVAVNQNDEIQWVRGSSRKTRYFRTDRYLKGAVEYHNKYHPDDIWEVRKCVILGDEPQTETFEAVDFGNGTVKYYNDDGETDCPWK